MSTRRQSISKEERCKVRTIHYHEFSPHLGTTVPDLSWRVGSLQETKVPASTKQAVHLQGGTLQACTIHYHVLGPPPKTHGENPMDKKCMEKKYMEKNYMEKSPWMYLLLTREDTPKPQNQAMHSIIPTLTPLCIHPYPPRNLPTQAPTHPGTHPPRHLLLTD